MCDAGRNPTKEGYNVDHDRRLVLIVQGDEVTTSYHFWLETPCDEHDGHVMTNTYPDEAGITAEAPSQWLTTALERASAQMCLCGAQNAPQDAVTDILRSTHG